MSAGWIGFIVALVVLNILGCVWLLWWTGRRRPGDPAPEDTSHVWDGDLTEYNKPLPKWWINLFYITIVFALGYLTWYGGWGNYAGTSKWTSKNEHAQVKALEDAKLEKTFAPYQGQSIDVLAKDPKAQSPARKVRNYMIGGLLIWSLPRLSPQYATLLAGGALLALVGMNFAFWQFADFVLPLAASVHKKVLRLAISSSINC